MIQTTDRTGLLIVSCFDLDSEYDSGVRNPNPWIQIWIWIQYCPWVGSGFKSVKFYGFGFGFGFNIVHGLGNLWIWIQYCPWVGSDFKSVKSYGFGFGVGFTLGHRLDWIIVAIALKGPSGPRHGPLSKKCTFWISPTPKLLKDPEKQNLDNTLHFY